MIWTLNLQNMFETPFSCFISKKLGEIDLELFQRKKSILAYIFAYSFVKKKRRASFYIFLQAFSVE